MFTEEPLWLDLRWARDEPDRNIRSSACLRSDLGTLAAPMHGLSKEELVGEDLAQFRRSKRLRRAAVAGLAAPAVVASVAAVVAVMNVRRADERSRVAFSRELTAQSRELLSRDRYELAGLAVAQAYARNGEIASLAVIGDVLRAWGVIAGAELTRDEPLVAVSVASDGARIAAASSSGGLRRWDVATGRASVVADTGRALMAAAFAPDGSVLAVGLADGDVELWDTTDGAVVTSINTAGPVTAFTWSPSGSLVAGAVDGNVQIWDAATGEQLQVMVLEDEREVSDLAFGPEEQILAGAAGDIRLWDVPSGDPLGSLGAVEDSFVALEFDASGDVATASIEGAVQFWDVADAAPRGPSAVGHDSIITELTVHPGGDIIASGGADGKVRLWDIETRQPVGAPLDAEAGDGVALLAFSSSGESLITVGAAGTVRIWDTDTAAWPDVLCGQLRPDKAEDDWRSLQPEREFSTACDGSGMLVEIR